MNCFYFMPLTPVVQLWLNQHTSFTIRQPRTHANVFTLLGQCLLARALTPDSLKKPGMV
ncbi:MAG: hypothetical protein KatS3mg110_3980 [Pirellulaceae bacterium]|nr:MAG: hypothetical protein KatS3mg110_3980 [Pirellulaceae bacterium]